MGLLISGGSVISWAINHASGRIAVASFMAFATAAIIDTIIYQFLYRYSYIIKINGSNVVSALADSLIFPTVAFGGFMPLITLGQYLAKILGGAIWIYLIYQSPIWNGRVSRR